MQTTQAKHTPGPWAVGDEERNNIVGPGGQVASVGPFASGGASRGDFDTMTANARLIAAAPELLAACIALLGESDPALEEAYERWVNLEDEAPEDVRTMLENEARAAIAKATT